MKPWLPHRCSQRAPSLACLMLASISGIACWPGERDPLEAWAEYVAAAGVCAGSWQLAPGTADTIPGAPRCIRELAISFTVPEHPPPGFSAQGPFGTAEVSFCGESQRATVVSVWPGQWFNASESGSGRPEPGGTTHLLELSPQDGRSGRLRLCWRPTTVGGTIREGRLVGGRQVEGLPVEFRAPRELESTPAISQALGYSPMLVYVRVQ